MIRNPLSCGLEKIQKTATLCVWMHLDNSVLKEWSSWSWEYKKLVHGTSVSWQWCRYNTLTQMHPTNWNVFESLYTYLFAHFSSRSLPKDLILPWRPWSLQRQIIPINQNVFVLLMNTCSSWQDIQNYRKNVTFSDGANVAIGTCPATTTDAGPETIDMN